MCDVLADVGLLVLCYTYAYEDAYSYHSIDSEGKRLTSELLPGSDKVFCSFAGCPGDEPPPASDAPRFMASPSDLLLYTRYIRTQQSPVSAFSHVLPPCSMARGPVSLLVHSSGHLAKWSDQDYVGADGRYIPPRANVAAAAVSVLTRLCGQRRITSLLSHRLGERAKLTTF